MTVTVTPSPQWLRGEAGPRDVTRVGKHAGGESERADRSPAKPRRSAVARKQCHRMCSRVRCRPNERRAV